MPPHNQRRRLSLETLESRRLLTMLAVTDEVYKTVRFTIEDGTYQAKITADKGEDGLYVDDFIGVADYTGTLVYNSPTDALGRLEAVGGGTGTDNYHDEEGDLDSYAFEFDGHGTLVDENGQFRLFSGDQNFRYTAGDQPNLANPNGRAGGSPFSTSVTGTLDTTALPWQVTGVFTRRTGAVTFDGDVELGPAALSETEPFDAAFESGVWLEEQGTVKIEFVSTGLVLPTPVAGRETPVADIRVYYASGPERQDILDEGNPIAGGDAIPIFWNSKEASITLTELPPAPAEAKYIIVVADYDGKIPETHEPNKGNNLLALSPAITVNSTEDTPDDDTTDFVCADADGNCTLRAAIQTANANANADTILFDLGSGNHVIEVETSTLPEITDPVIIDGASQDGYAENADGYPIPAIEVRGTAGLGPPEDGADISGFQVSAPSTTIRGLAIQGFLASGIVIKSGATDVRIERNVIGLDRLGQTVKPNQFGIRIEDAAANRVTRNVVAGNVNSEIVIEGEMAFDNVVSQNRVGVTADGQSHVLTQPIEQYTYENNHDGRNPNFGVHIFRASSNQVIDNQIAGEPTFIAEFPGSLILYAAAVDISGAGADHQFVRGNLLGFDANGAIGFALPPAPDDGFTVTYGRLQVATSGNRIADNHMTNLEVNSEGNASHGNRAVANIVTGNRIGVNATITDVPPYAAASSIDGDANVIGGPAIADRNYFGGRFDVFGDNNRVEGNHFNVRQDGQTIVTEKFIGEFGLLLAGENNLISKNRLAGFPTGIEVPFSGTNGNRIERNTIFDNAQKGISIFEATKITLSENEIYGNGTVGIDLNDDGATPNDYLDVDGGANGGQNFPSIHYASLTEIVGRLDPDLGVDTYRLEFFEDFISGQGHGQGRFYLGSVNITTEFGRDARFLFSFAEPLHEGICVTATATDSAGNTSEFSPCVPRRENALLGAAAEAGDTTLGVANNEAFEIGDTVVVDPNGPQQELAVVTGFGSLILSRPLRFDHPAGTTVIAVGPDFDADGIDNDIENDAPNNGDGNNDGILDAEQPHVVSLVNPVTGQYVTLVGSDGARLGDVNIVADPPATTPNGVNFPWGFLSYSLLGAPEDGRATVTAILAQTPDPQPNAYYHYGATLGDAAPHWYGFRFDEASGTGATWADTLYTFALQDGQRGDFDGAVNGVITALGGPAVNQASWHNAENPFDVNRDGLVGMQDLLLVVSNLRDPGPRPLVEPPNLNDPRVAMLDVDDNQRLDVHDLLVMVIELRRLLALNAGGSGEGELERMGAVSEEKDATLRFDESLATIANDVAATYSLTERKRRATVQLFRLPSQR